MNSYPNDPYNQQQGGPFANPPPSNNNYRQYNDQYNQPQQPQPGYQQGLINQGGPLDQGQYYNENKEDGLYTDSRNGFIRKVYTLLVIQLLTTAGIGAWGYSSPWFKQAFVNLPVLITLTVLIIAVSCMIACCMQTFRKYALPIFIVFTILMSLLVAIAISGYSSSAILTAVGITLFLVVGLTVYACTTKTDFTGMGPYLMMILMVLFAFGIFMIFWHNPVLQLVYSCLGALLFSIFLIYDTQLILGKGQFSYSLDDAYLASIQLYLDVINIFLYILSIFGGR